MARNARTLSTFFANSGLKNLLIHENPSQISRVNRPEILGAQSRGAATTNTTQAPLAKPEMAPSSMTATLLDGLVAAQDIRNQIKSDIEKIRSSINADFIPGLAIVQVGNREDSNVYIRMKIKNSKEVGIYSQHVRLPRSQNCRAIYIAWERKILPISDRLKGSSFLVISIAMPHAEIPHLCHYRDCIF